MKTLLALAAFFFFTSSTEVPRYSPIKLLPQGETIISYPIILNSGESLFGSPFGSTLKLADGANCPVIIVGGLDEEPTFTTSNVHISGITIIGNRENQSVEGWNGHPESGVKRSYIRNNGITVRRGSKVLIENVNVYGARSGSVVLEKGSSQVIVFGSKFTNSYFDGLAAYDSKNIYVSKCEIDSNDYAGISYDWDVTDSFVSDSSVSNNKREGIFMRDSRFNRFQNLKIINNNGPAIFLAKSEIEDSAAKHNIFSKIFFMGNTKALQNNDPEDCIGNLLVDPDYSLDSNLILSKK